MSEALKEAREYRDPTCPICEGEGCQCPGEEPIEEGFASDAQRRAAFAQGYKAVSYTHLTLPTILPV